MRSPREAPLLAWLLLGALQAWAQPARVEWDRPKTLLGQGFGRLAEWRASQALGEKDLRFGLVRDDADSSWRSALNFGSESSPLWFGPVSGVELRSVGDTDRVAQWEGGVRAMGRKGALWFSTDARIFTERHTDDAAASWDGEVVDHSTQGQLSHATFTSFSRYRATVEWATDIGAFGIRREPIHWGPGRFGNLVFNNEAIPFPYAYWQGDFGSVSLEAIWGALTIDGIGDYRRTHDTRSVYGHRYEWRPVPDLELGISEQLILFNQQSVTGLVPFVPLFIDKGETAERENNGNIAFDAAFRKWNCLFYGEFLIDDMQEPTSLFSDQYWGNRWASLLGVSWAKRRPDRSLVSVGLEWSRVEPWVYTHFAPNSAQALNQGAPLGNPDGPNSQSIHWDVAYHAPTYGGSLDLKARWKGTDLGSSATDTIGSNTRSGKVFLAGIDRPDWEPGLKVWKSFQNVSIQGEAILVDDAWTGSVRTLVWY